MNHSEQAALGAHVTTQPCSAEFLAECPAECTPGPLVRTRSKRVLGLVWRLVCAVVLTVIMASVFQSVFARLWFLLSYKLVTLLYTDSVVLDLYGVAIPLAAGSVAFAIYTLWLVPLFIAFCASAYSWQRRIFGAFAAFFVGLSIFVVWENSMSLHDGYGFILRHAVYKPMTDMDFTGLFGACFLELWAVLYILPFRKAGGLLAWIGQPG